MQLVLYSWNGNLINDFVPPSTGNFSSFFPVGQRSNLNGQPVYIQRANDFPALSGSILQAHTMTFKVICRGTIHLQREQLKGWFNIADFTPRQLIAQDAADSNRQWYLTGITQKVIEESIGVMTVTISLTDPVWRPVVASTDTWNITASGQTHTVALVRGDIPAHPVLTITATSGRTGQWAYKVWCPIYNQMTIPFTFYPYDVTQGGLNTSALVTGGKMQSSGNDFVVQVDGALVDRWLDSMNTTSTKCWVNLNLSAKWEATLGASIAGTGAVSSIQLVVQDSSYNFLSAVQSANNQVVLIDSEAFTFTGVDLVNYQLTGVTRAQKGTAMAAHTASSTEAVRWIEHDVWVLYGNSAATAPMVDDSKKPMIDMHNSTNTSWVWTGFSDDLSSRPAAWSGKISESYGGLSTIYTGNHIALVNPATEMGIAMAAYQTQNIWKAETGTLIWVMNNPAGFTTVSASGSKFTSLANNFPSVAGLQYLTQVTTQYTFQQAQGGGGRRKHHREQTWVTVTGYTTTSTWTSVWNEAAPSNANTWTTFTHPTASLGGSYPNIRFILSGSVSAQINGLAAIQFDTVTGALDSTHTPVGTYGAEQSSYYINCQIKNTRTDGQTYSIFLAYPIGISPANVVIDTNAKTVTASDGSNILPSLSFDTVRAQWLDFLNGSNANQLTFVDSGTGNVTISLSWADRSY